MKKKLNILIYSFLTLMLAIGCLFGVSSFMGNKALALTRGGEEIYVGTSSIFNVKSGTIGTSGTDAIYNDGMLNISGGTINGNIKNNGTINYSAGTINGTVTLAKGKYINLDVNPTSTIKIKLENGAVGDTIASVRSMASLILSNLSVTNLPANTRLVVESNEVKIKPVLRTITFSVKESGYGTVTNSAGTAVTNIAVDHGSTVTISGDKLTVGGNTYTATATTITGYTTTFSSWSVSNNSTITANTTITANFTRTINKYTLTFNANGGTLPSVQTLTTAGSTICVLGGRTFTKTNAGTAYAAYVASVLHGDGNRWSAPLLVSTTSSAVTYTSGAGGTFTYSGSLVFNGTTYYYSNTEHWMSAGLSDTSGTGRTRIESAQSIKEAAEQLLILINKQKTLTYNAAYGTMPTPTKTGYTFKGWYTAASGGSQVSSSTTIGATNVNVYAQYTANTYNISWVLNGGSGTSAPPSNPVTYDNVFYLCNLTKTGYTFTGWTASGLDTSTAKHGTTNNPTTAWDGTTKVTSTYFKNLTPTNGGTVTLTANWEINKYTITFESNNGNYGYTEKSIQTNVPYGSTISVSNYTITINGINNRAMGVPQAEGYTPTFNGWYIGSTKITANQTVTGDMTITANFSRTANKYTVSFQPHGSPDYCAPITVTYNSTYGTLPSPTKSGYVFRGWWTGENGTGSNVTSSTRVTRTENHTLYARWDQIYLYVDGKDNGSVDHPQVSLSPGDKITFDNGGNNGWFDIYVNGVIASSVTAGDGLCGVSIDGDWYTGDDSFIEEISITVSGNVYINVYFCFDINTDILVWDDEKKRVVRKKAKDIKYTDKLLVWNFDKGCLDFAYPLFIQAHKSVNTYTEIKFSDGTVLNIAREHTVFNVDKGKFCPVISDWEVYGCPIGTRVLKDNGDIVTIVSKRRVHKNLTYTNIITNYHMNCYTNGILSSTPLNNKYPIKDMKFEINDSKCEDLSLLEGIDEEWIKGLRLDTIPDKIIRQMTSHNNGINSMKDYIQEKINLMKPKDEK